MNLAVEMARQIFGYARDVYGDVAIDLRPKFSNLAVYAVTKLLGPSAEWPKKRLDFRIAED